MTGALDPARPEDVGLSRERLARIGTLLEADVERGRVPGAVVLVARRGRVAYFKAFGRLDPAGDDPMALETLFRIYSMTKPIVSVAVMQLAEEGRLTLADWASDYVPAFKDVRVGVERDGALDLVAPDRPITLHDLLRHTSGLTYEFIDDGPVSRAYAAAEAGARRRTNAEEAQVLARLPLKSQPGTRWDYGRSTDLLGSILEVVTGRTLGEWLDERIFAPLGMGETGFRLPADLAGRLAQPFPTDPDTGEPIRLFDPTLPAAFESGGGGLVSTAPDYARFLTALAGGGALGEARVLGPATIAFMLADHLPPGVAAGSDLLPEGYGFGLGFAVRRAAGIAAFPGSAGDAYWEGMGGTGFFLDPARELFAILMVQAPGRREHYRRVLRQLVYAAVDD